MLDALRKLMHRLFRRNRRPQGHHQPPPPQRPASRDYGGEPSLNAEEPTTNWVKRIERPEGSGGNNSDWMRERLRSLSDELRNRGKQKKDRGRDR